MPEKACAPRIAQLTQRLSELEARRTELVAADEDGLEPLLATTTSTRCRRTSPT